MTRIVFVGDEGIGKTALLTRYTTNHFCSVINYVIKEYQETIIEEFEHLTDRHVLLVDTPGSPSMDRLRPFSYLDASLFVLCFSMDSEKSFMEIEEKFLPECCYFSPKTPFCLLALKKDRGAAIDLQGRELSKRIGALDYYEISAKESSIDDIIRLIDSICGLLKTRETSAATLVNPEEQEEEQGDRLAVVSLNEKRLSNLEIPLKFSSLSRSETRDQYIQLSNLVKVPLPKPQNKPKTKDASCSPILPFVSREISTQTEPFEGINCDKPMDSLLPGARDGRLARASTPNLSATKQLTVTHSQRIGDISSAFRHGSIPQQPMPCREPPPRQQQQQQQQQQVIEKKKSFWKRIGIWK